MKSNAKGPRVWPRMIPDVACEHLRWPLYAIPRGSDTGSAQRLRAVECARAPHELLAYGYPTGLHQR
jgi:hypothetical protein